MVSPTKIVETRDTLYETFLCSYELIEFFINLIKVNVLLILNSFLAKGLRHLVINFDTLYM